MVKVGILGAAGYTGGELIRVLLNHPSAEIVFANSESNAGNLVSNVHESLVGETDLCFTSEMPWDQIDVVFFCFGHGKSEAFLQEHEIPSRVKIIDLAQDFRIAGNHDYIYGLPEIHREQIRTAMHVANPGCFATCIQLGLLMSALMPSQVVQVRGRNLEQQHISAGETTISVFTNSSLTSICMKYARHSMRYVPHLLLIS